MNIHGTQLGPLDLTEAELITAAQTLLRMLQARADRRENILKDMAALLDGQQWSTDTLEAIADHLRAAGYEIRSPEETEELEEKASFVSTLEYSVCVDCFEAVAGIGEADLQPHLDRELDGRPGHLVTGVAPSEGDEEGTAYEEFSNYACELCNSTLGGTRHGVTLLIYAKEEPEDAEHN